ncbi:MAG: ATP-binding protein [Bacteroides sp.]|nr:ATP-binding protein [Bacteroides sp.]
MILKSFKYSNPNWTLDTLILGQANLIVGKNSSGKSRALRALNQVISLLSQRKMEDGRLIFDSELILNDPEEGNIYIYLSIEGDNIVKEILKVNEEIKIERDKEKAIIEGDNANPPADMLLMHVRRDVQKYNYIEKIIEWAEKTVIRSFIDKTSPTHEELFEHVLKFTPEMCRHLVRLANKVGFPLKDFGTFKNVFLRPKKRSLDNGADSIKIILLKEKNVTDPLQLNNLSSGMYRTILLLILIEQFINLDRPALLAIDDLGEGLDYSRATDVGKLLFDICEKNNIQLIATSNEEFMMNIVDISKWNILVREGQNVKSVTSELCPDEFEDFKFTGLNNYDFFTSDFLNRISSNLFPKK